MYTIGILFFYFFISGTPTNLVHAVPLKGERIEIATMHEFPFIASLQTKIPHNSRKEKHVCTGSLITVKDVLTAGHCIVNLQPDDVNVILGVIDVNTKNSAYNLKWWVTYDQWAHNFEISKQFYDHDLAILRLSTSVLRTNVIPLIIAESTTPQLYRTKAVIVGWGVRSNSGRLAKRLRKATVEIYTPEVCERQIFLVSNRLLSFGQNELCSAAKPFALTTCGDSGGPLLDKNNNLIGVNIGSCVNESLHSGTFSEQFINQYQINIHLSIDFYRGFIDSVTSI